MDHGFPERTALVWEMSAHTSDSEQKTLTHTRIGVVHVYLDYWRKIPPS